MQILIAFAHIAGAIFASSLVFVACVYTLRRMSSRLILSELESMAHKLGVPLSALDEDTMPRPVAALMYERFSNDVLANRLADACGTLLSVAGWLSSLLSLAITGWVAYEMWSSGADNAVMIWTAAFLSMATSVAILVMAAICMVLTGRLPGQPKRTRKFLKP